MLIRQRSPWGFNDRCRTQYTGAVDGGGTVEPLLNDFPESGHFTKSQFLVDSTVSCNYDTLLFWTHCVGSIVPILEVSLGTRPSFQFSEGLVLRLNRGIHYNPKMSYCVQISWYSRSVEHFSTLLLHVCGTSE